MQNAVEHVTTGVAPRHAETSTAGITQRQTQMTEVDTTLTMIDTVDRATAEITHLPLMTAPEMT